MKYYPVIWLNHAAQEAAERGDPIGRDRYGYLCRADDPACTEAPNPAIGAQLARLGFPAPAVLYAPVPVAVM